MIRFAIKDFSLKDNAYEVMGILPGGFAGMVKIGMTEDLKSVLTKLNNLSGAVQGQFLPMWLMNQEVEIPKNGQDGNKKEEKNVPLIVGAEDSSTT